MRSRLGILLMPMPCLAAFHVSHRLLMVLTILALLIFAACQSPVTSGGRPVTNEALATAVRAVNVTEKALVAAADGMTAGYEAGLIPASVLQNFQATIAPKVRAALATAEAAMKTMEKAPDSTPMTLVLAAVLALQEELADLQGFYTSHALIVPGASK